MDGQEFGKVLVLKLPYVILGFTENHDLLVFVVCNVPLDVTHNVVNSVGNYSLVDKLVGQLVLGVSHQVNHHRVFHVFLDDLCDFLRNCG